MTTLFALLLAMTLLFGCSAGPVSDVKLAALPAREPLVQTQEDPVAQALRYEVEMTLREDTLSAEDGTVLLRYAFEVPVLSVWRADGSALTEAATPRRLPPWPRRTASTSSLTPGLTAVTWRSWCRRRRSTLPLSKRPV